jgi:hypothetical protein
MTMKANLLEKEMGQMTSASCLPEKIGILKVFYSVFLDL